MLAGEVRINFQSPSRFYIHIFFCELVFDPSSISGKRCWFLLAAFALRGH
jgi:hypothetical protein